MATPVLMITTPLVSRIRAPYQAMLPLPTVRARDPWIMLAHRLGA